MKTKLIILIMIAAFVVVTSCKKEKSAPAAQLSTEQINNCVEGATVISAGVNSFLSQSLAVAADSGYKTGSPPSSNGKVFNGSLSNTFLKSAKVSTSAKLNMDWIGPDKDGWYMRSWSAMYNYTEKFRKKDTVDYILTVEYHGADGSYENITTTKYIKYTRSNKTYFKGFSKWEINVFGYNDISRMGWKIEFSDWAATSGAGIYDWYWGVSENNGGNTVPYHRYEHLQATEKTTKLLHVKSIWYDDAGAKIWDFEYDTSFVSVEMPEIPSI